MPNSNEKGDRRERELVNALDEAGFAVMRAPSSGSATERELPDVLAGDGDVFYAIEAKSSSGDPIYLSGEEIEALVYFSRNFGAKPRVGVRFDREDWYFFHPGDLHATDGGNYRVKKETALAEGTDFAEFTGQSRKVALGESGSGSGSGSESDSGVGSGSGSGGATGTSTDADVASDEEGADDAVREILGALERGDLSVDDAAEML